MNEDQDTFAALSRRRREAKGMTQSILAQAAGVTERTVQRVERGEAPSSETVKALCAVLEIAPTEARAALVRSGFDACPTLAILPVAHGPKAERTRDDAVKTLTRAHPNLPLVVATDQVAASKAYVTPKMLRRLGLDWKSRENVEDVVDAAVARSVRFLLRRIHRDLSENLQIAATVVIGFSPLVIVAVALSYLRDLVHVIGETAATWAIWVACGLLSAQFVSLLVSTRAERAAARIAGNDVAVGIEGTRIYLTGGSRRPIREIALKDVTRMSIGDRGTSHVALDIDLVSGDALRVDFLPRVPALMEALARMERTLAAMDARTVSATPEGLLASA